MLDKTGIVMDEEELESVQPNHAENCVKYNTKKKIETKSCSMAVSFLKRANKSRYAWLWKDLENLYMR